MSEWYYSVTSSKVAGSSPSLYYSAEVVHRNGKLSAILTAPTPSTPFPRKCTHRPSTQRRPPVRTMELALEPPFVAAPCGDRPRMNRSVRPVIKSRQTLQVSKKATASHGEPSILGLTQNSEPGLLELIE